MQREEPVLRDRPNVPGPSALKPRSPEAKPSPNGALCPDPGAEAPFGSKRSAYLRCRAQIQNKAFQSGRR